MVFISNILKEKAEVVQRVSNGILPTFNEWRDKHSSSAIGVATDPIGELYTFSNLLETLRMCEEMMRKQSSNTEKRASFLETGGV